MRKTASTLLLLAAMFLAGCRDREQGRGYFYVTSLKDGYVVAVDGTADAPNFGVSTTLYVTKPMPLPEAKALCDQMNDKLDGHQITNVP